MLFATFEWFDFAIRTFFIIVFIGMAAAARARVHRFRMNVRARLERVEGKVDLIMTNLGLAYTPPPKAPWQEIAANPARRTDAIKAYREEHGVGLAEAKVAVEEYML